MKKTLKTFRINFIVSYMLTDEAHEIRVPIQHILRSLAFLHALEYWIDESTRIFDHLPTETESDSDIIYFRSTENTRITEKRLMKVLEDVFSASHLSSSGVDCFCQTAEGLQLYPFPDKCLKHISPVHIEYHQKDGQVQKLSATLGQMPISHGIVGLN